MIIILWNEENNMFLNFVTSVGHGKVLSLNEELKFRPGELYFCMLISPHCISSTLKIQGNFIWGVRHFFTF